jgi:hypothetical protein
MRGSGGGLTHGTTPGLYAVRLGKPKKKCEDNRSGGRNLKPGPQQWEAECQPLKSEVC